MWSPSASKPFALSVTMLLLSVLLARAQAPSPKATTSQPTLAKAEFQAALAAYRTQQYKKAEADLRSLLALEPSNFEVNELAGLVFLAEEEYALADKYLAKAVKIRPKVIEARTAFAANLFRLNRVAEAEAEFKNIVALAPDSYDANHNLGEFYLQAGNLSAGIPFLRHAQEIRPDAYNNGYDLALAYEENQQLDESRQLLRRLLRLQDSAELHGLLGEVEEKSKNYLEAAKEYEKAARSDPTEVNLLNWGAELLLHQTFEPAVQVFTSALTRYPQSARLQNGLGIALYGMGHFDDAAHAFFRAADLNPPDSLPLSFLGRGYDNLSPEVREEVRNRLKSFIGRDSSNAPLLYYYAMCLRRQNETQPSPEMAAQIESLLRSSIAIDPTFADAHLQLGISYAEQRKYEEAIAEYQQALRITPENASTHYRLGQALAKSGNAERAKEEFARFEQLRQSAVDQANKEHNEIQQFVYTMRKPDGNDRN